MREVLVDLLVVDDLALELLLDPALLNAVIVHLARVAELQPVQLATHALQERAAPGPRAAQHGQQLAALQQPVEALQDMPPLALLVAFAPATKHLADASWCREDGADCVLELQRRAGAVDVEVADADAELVLSVAFGAHLAHEVAHPFGDVEVGAGGVEGGVPRESVAGVGVVPREGRGDLLELIDVGLVHVGEAMAGVVAVVAV